MDYLQDAPQNLKAESMKSTDYEFDWFIKKNGSGWNTWRDLAATWLKLKDYGVDHTLGALNRFLDEYLVPRFIIDPIEFFETKGQDYDQFLKPYELSEHYHARQNNEVCAFIDWVIETYYSQPDDNDVLIPMFNNPFVKQANPIKGQETVYNALPYSYIKQLRNILCPSPRGDFKDWKWAIKKSQPTGLYLRDWFIVDELHIDKHDPDCVWQEMVIEKSRSLRINNVLHRYAAGDRLYLMWSPVRAVGLYIKLELPLRTYQVRMLDSGEADTWRYDGGQWAANEKHVFVEGSVKRPWKKGVFNRIITPDIGDVMSGLYINTNKTADKNKDEITRGYVIPWQNEDVLYWLEKLRNWQEKYNPIAAPTSIHDLEYKHFGGTKTEVQRNEIGDICFLFRNAASSVEREKGLPITGRMMESLWAQLLAQLEHNVYQKGQRLSDGRKICFVDENNQKRTLFPLHSLRVSLITCYAIDGEIPTPVLSKLLVGHSRLIMTMHYTKVTPVMMAKKMKEAENKITDRDDESLITFLANKSIEEIGLNVACPNAESLSAALRVRNPAGWQEKAIGVCLAGGNTSPLVENGAVAGCWNGGEKLKKANRHQSDLHAPVPHGIENCIRCRWFITDIKYIHSLTAHLNNLSYHASESAKLAAELESEQESLLDEEYFCEVNGESFKKYEQLHRLYRRVEKQKTDADEYCKDLVACFQIIRHLLKIEEQRLPYDTKDKIVAIGSENEISPFFSFLETESEFRQLIQLCDDAEIYPDLRDDLKKTPAISHRSNYLNQMLMKSGYMPFLMQLDDETQLIAGNAMVNAMLRATGEKNSTKAMTHLASYLDTESYLVDAGLIEKGVKAIESQTGINILRLADMTQKHNLGAKK